MADFLELAQATNVRLSYGFALKAETISPTGWALIHSARCWCLQQYGMGNHWGYQHDTFAFEYSNDAMMFKLRWC